MKIELGKYYKTRNGHKARIICVDRKHPEFPVISLIYEDDRECVNSHTVNGAWDVGSRLSNNDLISEWVDKPVITAPWPAWAKAAAMDNSDIWWWYDYVPIMLAYSWVYPEGTIIKEHARRFHHSEIPAWTGDWKDSLVLRPV